ncbi:AI-2E family transporter [Anatilimnocola floriformis]|uniref:AI-2E family transporter n=1 Tax=Anatilimnocola floriformis TaxID=2948575 RepID=UPI0020C4E868|nr:AI-2E family transporter [Anatilimnocola floriformis]
MARLVSFLVLLLILVLIALLFFRVMASFMLPLFLAALLVVVFHPLYTWMLERCWKQRYVAATLTTIMVMLCVLAPAALVFTLAGAQGASLASQVRGTNVREKLDELRAAYSLDIPRRDHLQQIEATLNSYREFLRRGETPNYKRIHNAYTRLAAIEEWRTAGKGKDLGLIAFPESLQKQLETLQTADADSPEADQALLDAIAEFRIYKRDLLGGGFQAFVKELVNPSDEQIDALMKDYYEPIISRGKETAVLVGKVVLGILVVIATLFFLFAEGSRILDGAIRLSPLEERYVRELVNEFDRVCRAVVAATLLSAVAQGILAGIGFYIAGFYVPGLQQSVALLMLLTMVLAMVPFTGAATVWVPVSLYIWLYAGQFGPAVGLAIYGALIVSTADNFIKPMVLHGQSNLHPLLALLSVIGGIQSLGPIGILVGPMVVVFLQTLLKILQRELITMDKLTAAAAAIGVQLPAFGPRPAEATTSTEITVSPVDPATGIPIEAAPEPKSNGSPPAKPVQRSKPKKKR